MTSFVDCNDCTHLNLDLLGADELARLGCLQLVGKLSLGVLEEMRLACYNLHLNSCLLVDFLLEGRFLEVKLALGVGNSRVSCELLTHARAVALCLLHHASVHVQDHINN